MNWENTPLLCPECDTKRDIKGNYWVCPKCGKREMITDTEYMRRLKKDRERYMKKNYPD